MEAKAERRRRGRIAAWLFLAFAGLYVLGSPPQLDTPDAVVMYRVTASLVDRRRIDIRPLEAWPGFGGQVVLEKRDRRVRFYSKFGLGQSLAAVPPYVAAKLLLPWALDREKDVFSIRPAPQLEALPPSSDYVLPGVDRFRVTWYDPGRANFAEAFGAFFVGLTNAFVVAATVTLLFGIVLALGYGEWCALGIALLAGLATPLWAYSKTFFSEPLGAFGLTAFLYLALLSSRAERGRGLAMGAGLSLGLTVLAKPAHLVLVPGGLLLMGLYARKGTAEARRRWERLAAFGIGLAAMAALIAAYSWVRFGSPLATGYGKEAQRFSMPFLTGLSGLLVSPGRGLLLYAPVWLLSVLSARRFARSWPAETAFVAVSHAALLLLYSRWWGWDGGWCWGPRFLVPILPLLVLPAAALLDRPPAAAVPRVLVLLVVGLSLCVSLSGTLVSFIDFNNWLRLYGERYHAELVRQGIRDYYQLLRWEPAFSPLLRCVDFPTRDYFLLPRALAAPGVVLAVLGLAALAAVLGVVGIVRELRRPAREPEG